MIASLKRLFGIWPSTQQALQKPAECVAVGKNVYVVKSATGAVDALRLEVIAMQRSCLQDQAVTTATGKILTKINECQLPYPKTLFFGEPGVVEIQAVSYNVCIADMQDL